MKAVGILLFIVLIAAGGFYLGQKYKLVPAAIPQPTVTETITPIPTPTQGTIAPTPTTDEKASLVADVRAGLIAEHGAQAGSMTIDVSTIEGNFAKGMANDQGGGGLWFAAKVQGQWKLVWDGNGIIQCSDLTNYSDFPTTMIPECFDTATQKMITR